MARGDGQGVGGGRPPKLNQKTIDKLVDGIKKTLILRHAAGLAEIHVVSVYNWLAIGEQDIRDGKWTDHARFFYALRKAQADEVAQLIVEIKAKVKSWQALAWLLERCFREDFGADAGIIQQLLEKAEKMEQTLKRLERNPLQGAINDGEMDSKGNQKEGCA